MGNTEHWLPTIVAAILVYGLARRRRAKPPTAQVSAFEPE